MAETDDMFSVSEDDIKNADDVDTLFDLGDLLGVDLAGLVTTEEIKERLLMAHRTNEYGDFKQMIEKAMQGVQRENLQKRNRLVEMLIICQDTFQNYKKETEDEKGNEGIQAIEGFLKTEGIINELSEDIQRRKRLVEKGDCVVVVSGETGAGKSTVLNLLLEENLLPTHALPCSSVVTRISYADKNGARIIYKGDKEDYVIKNCDIKSLREILKDILFEKDAEKRELVSDVREVQVYISANLLRCGLVIVDSPGIGENELMDSVIGNFVSANEIMGFIYLIKSDSAGGVDEDKLGALLRLIMENQKKRSSQSGLPFDPSCAIFICNLWDLIQKEEQPKVFDHACSRLHKYWTNLSRSQVLRFSAKKANRELSVSRKFITDDYMKLLMAIQELHSKAMERRIYSTFKWIDNLLTRGIHHSKTIVRQINNDENLGKEKIQDLSQKLEILKKDSDSIVTTLRSKVDETALEICKNFREHLQLPQTRLRITNWIEKEVPQSDSCNWEEIKEQIDDITADRVSLELKEWDEEKNWVKKLEDELYQEVKEEFRGLENQIGKIEQDISMSRNSNDREDMHSTISHRRGKFAAKRLSTFSLSNMNVYLSSTSSQSAEEELMPLNVSILARYISPIKNIARNFKMKIRRSTIYDSVVVSKKMQEFKAHPTKIAHKKSEKFLKMCVDEKHDIMIDFIQALLERPCQFLQMLEMRIPSVIKANQEALDHIIHCRSDSIESRETYVKMMTDFEKLREKLREYGKGYIFVADYNVNELRVRDHSCKTGHKSFRSSDVARTISSSTMVQEPGKELERGLWTGFQNGYHMNKEGQEHNIFIRVYLPSSGVTEVHSEIAKLRSLQNQHVAEFLGISHSDAPTPALIYDGHLTSVNDYLKHHPLERDVQVKRILHEVVEGMVYLHERDMVHMELTSSTVKVSKEKLTNGIVKLSGACLPKKAMLPLDKDHVQAQEFVYLSKGVLSGEMYTAKDDVYSFGLFMFEMLLIVGAFEAQRSMKLSDFILGVDAATMLNLKQSLVEINETSKDLIMRSLLNDPELRPSISDFLVIFSTDHHRHDRRRRRGSTSTFSQETLPE
ncbi:uncharacterized protein LOC134273229 [Saccostrea cucullata]|uniref:uncharacterized protein LOC134273229 n=1 Tax=Saccostrea cuccullata TaxID=36930 RepID=UPI002ED57581